MWNISKHVRDMRIPSQPTFFTSLTVVCVFVAISAILSWFVALYPLANGNKQLIHVVHNQNHTPTSGVSQSPTASSLAGTATATPTNPATTATAVPTLSTAKVGTTPITGTNPTSAPAVPTPTSVPVLVSGTINDYLNDWSKTYSHTANLFFDTNNSQFMDGDTSLVVRGAGSFTHEAIVWRQTGITSFSAKTYFWPNEAVSAFSVLVSTDGTNWTTVSPAITTPGVSNWTLYTYTLNSLSNVNYVKMVWNSMQGNSWTPQIGQVTIGYAYTR